MLAIKHGEFYGALGIATVGGLLIRLPIRTAVQRTRTGDNTVRVLS